MRVLFTKDVLVISSGQAVSGVARRAHTLHVTQGSVWITVEGIPHDYWLHAGDSFTTLPGRLTVVEAGRGDGRIECLPGIQWLKTLKLLLTDIASHFAGGRTVAMKRHRPCGAGCGETV